MRIVFMGTPDIARTALSVLLSEGHDVVAVYTREDKPVGRKQIITPPPVKLCAAENRIPVEQPKTLRTADAAATLESYAPDLVVVVAYGLILPPEVLEVPKYGCINLHVSLLPNYRGAAPIQWAVINGEEKTGVTIMQLDEGMDTGPVYASKEIDIAPNATAGEVFQLATGIGARLLAQTVQEIADGTAEAFPQQGEATMAPQLNKAMAEIDFNLPAKRVHNLVRGCNPWPLAWFNCGEKRVKLSATKLNERMNGTPGRVLSTSPLTIGCGEGSLVLEYVVPEGARPMTGAEWAAGRRFKAGDMLV